MVVNMAIMIAINIGVMVYKSVKKSRRMRRLTAIKEAKLAKHNAAMELLEANKAFEPVKGMS